MVKNLPASGGNMGSIPGLEKSPGEGNGNPLLYSCLENPRDGEEAGLGLDSAVERGRVTPGQAP